MTRKCQGDAACACDGGSLPFLNEQAQSLMARDFDRQVAEIQVRGAVLNRYTALGIPVTEPVG